METQNNNEELTLKEIFNTLKKWKNEILKYWWLLLIFIVIGILGGFLYSYLSPKEYVAETNFVLSENETDGSNQLAVLGFGEEQSVGLFEGDNLLWLYKSRYMVRQALLSPVSSDSNSSGLLINWFIDIDEDLQETLNTLNAKGASINFTLDTLNYKDNREHNIILNQAIDKIVNNNLEVTNIDKTTGVINVKVTTTDELFSKSFCEVLVKCVNSFYIQTKTKKASDHVALLKSKVDNLDESTKKSMYSTAQAVENIPYPNPNLKTIHVEEQKLGIDANISANIYTMLYQQLESAEMALSKVTPLIQIVDSPTLPLKVSKPAMKSSVLIGGILAFIIGIGYILLRYMFRSYAD